MFFYIHPNNLETKLAETDLLTFACLSQLLGQRCPSELVAPVCLPPAPVLTSVVS